MVTIFLLLLGESALGFTVSGFSSGAYFATQLHVAYSSSITGVGVIAGGPYYCSLGSLVRAETACSRNAYLISLESSIQYAIESSTSNLIDNINNITNDRVYIFSGLLDTSVFPEAVHLTEQFYRYFIQNDYKILTNYSVPAAHSWVTDFCCSPCWAYQYPGINNCGFDMAEEMLSHLLGNLEPKQPQVPGNLLSFNQAKYADVWQAGMSTKGWIYLPRNCVNSTCRVHVVLHGCTQYYDLLGDPFIKYTGVNEWAEGNNITVIYPQTVSSTNNPDGCWDFWGYTNSNFTLKSGLQLKAVWSMAQNPPYVNWTADN